MRDAALVTLNMRELDRLKVVQAIVETGLKPGRAAERLGLSVRQVERLVTRYRTSGAAAANTANRGNARTSTSDATAQAIACCDL